MADQRNSERLAILGALSGAITTVQPVAVRDISRDGLTIETAFPIQPDSLHELRLSLHPQAVVVKVRAVHSSISDIDSNVVIYRTGLEYVDISPAVSTIIESFLESMRAWRADA